MIGRPADVVSKKRGDEPETHYLIGPQRETLPAAREDLAAWLRLEGREAGADRDNRPFPIVRAPNMIDTVPRSIPWWVAQVAHRQYVREYGNIQSLERLAERGGFHWTELGMLLAAGIAAEAG